MSSWFESMTRFFGRLTSRQDNRIKPSEEEDELMSHATKDEIIKWEREMQEKVRNKLSLKEAKLKEKRRKFRKSTKSKLGGRRHNHDEDTRSELGLTGMLNEVKKAKEECNIEKDYSDTDTEIGRCNDDSDEDNSSESSRSESSQENMSEQGPPEHPIKPIMDKDQFSEFGDEAEAEAETDETSTDESEELELLEKQRDYDEQSSIQSNDKDSESDIDLNVQNNNLHVIRDLESGIDLEARNNNFCYESKSKENALGRRRISQVVVVAKTVECYNCDITPTISDENVGNGMSFGEASMRFSATECPKSVRKSGTKFPATENRNSIRKSATKLPTTENRESIRKSATKLLSSENRKSIEKSKTKLPVTEEPEEAPLTEFWVKQSPVVRNLENADNNLPKIVNYYILPERPEPKVTQIQQDTKATLIIEKPLISHVKVKATRRKETKQDLKVDQNANPMRVEEKAVAKDLLLKSSPSPNVPKSTNKTGESSSTVGFLRRGARWISSKITSKNKISGVTTTTGEPARIPSKLRTDDTGPRLMRLSKEVLNDPVPHPRDTKRVKMLSYLKGSRADGSQGKSISRIHDGVFHQSDGDGGRRGRNFLEKSDRDRM